MILSICCQLLLNHESLCLCCRPPSSRCNNCPIGSISRLKLPCFRSNGAPHAHSEPTHKATHIYHIFCISLWTPVWNETNLFLSLLYQTSATSSLNQVFHAVNRGVRELLLCFPCQLSALTTGATLFPWCTAKMAEAGGIDWGRWKVEWCHMPGVIDWQVSRRYPEAFTRANCAPAQVKFKDCFISSNVCSVRDGKTEKMTHQQAEFFQPLLVTEWEFPAGDLIHRWPWINVDMQLKSGHPLSFKDTASQGHWHWINITPRAGTFWFYF